MSDFIATETADQPFAVRATTQHGVIEGLSYGTVTAFLGVPYGAPASGESRFRPPRPCAAWTGVRTAKTWGPRSFQSMAIHPLQAAFPRTFEAIAGDDLLNVPPMGEDCLTLNIWAPVNGIQGSMSTAQDGEVGERRDVWHPSVSSSADPPRSAASRGSGQSDTSNGTRPVLVWLHGGGSNGSPSESRADGRALARRGDVVVVSITHRLNVFGYLYLGAVAGEEYSTSGSAGHVDLVLALQWVRDNIHRFGGDPDNVTIFGESAGGAKVAWLMTMPEARGLFHKAAIQSGAETTTGLSTNTSHAEEFTDGFLAELDLTPESWRRLLDVPPERLVAAHEGVSAKLKIPYVLAPPGATVSGPVLRRKPMDAVEEGAAANVPLMIGACADELQLFTMKRDYLAEQPGEERRAEIGDAGPAPLAPSGYAELREWLGEGADRIIADYGRTRPGATPDQVEAAIRGDRQFLIPSLRFAEAYLNNGFGPVFTYSFAWKSDLVPEIGAFHSLDIPFFFDRTQAIPIAYRDATAAPLAAQMSDALIAFARTGSPSHAGIPEWPRYRRVDRATMIFDRECRVENDPRSTDRSAWDGIETARLGF